MSKKLGFALSGIMLAMAAGTAFAANDMDGGQSAWSLITPVKLVLMAVTKMV